MERSGHRVRCDTDTVLAGVGSLAVRPVPVVVDTRRFSRLVFPERPRQAVKPTLKLGNVMAKISIRTLMLITLWVAMQIAIFTGGASSANMFHTILVLAFAIPGASWGYDRNPTSRSVMIGLCTWAVVGALVLSGLVLIGWFG